MSICIPAYSSPCSCQNRFSFSYVVQEHNTCLDFLINFLYQHIYCNLLLTLKNRSMGRWLGFFATEKKSVMDSYVFPDPGI